MDATEKTPLLRERRSFSEEGESSMRLSGTSEPAEHAIHASDKIEMKRHITMWNAVFIIIGSVIGSGIFIAPKGVTENVNSVGASLIIWAVTGFINLGQALCYAELGGLIPVAGGDYAYLYYILGPLPAFLVAWLHIFVISASGCAVIARTAALYLIQPLGLGCRTEIITLLAAILIGRLWVIYTFQLSVTCIVTALFLCKETCTEYSLTLLLRGQVYCKCNIRVSDSQLFGLKILNFQIC